MSNNDVLFFHYIIQILLALVAMCFCTKGLWQRWVLAAVFAPTIFYFIIQGSLGLTVEQEIEQSIWMSCFFSIMPIFYFELVPGRTEWAERLLSIQQTWARIAFLYWCQDQYVNLQHYSVGDSFSEPLAAIALGLVIIALVFSKKVYWPLVVQSVLSVFCIALSLQFLPNQAGLLLIWFVSIGVIAIMPNNAGAKFSPVLAIIKRFEQGALGGGVFWSSILLIQLAGYSKAEDSIVWTLVIFFMAALAWIMNTHDVDGSKSEFKKEIAKRWTSAKVAFQLGLVIFVLIWPWLRGAGGIF